MFRKVFPECRLTQSLCVWHESNKVSNIKASLNSSNHTALNTIDNAHQKLLYNSRAHAIKHKLSRSSVMQTLRIYNTTRVDWTLDIGGKNLFGNWSFEKLCIVIYLYYYVL